MKSGFTLVEICIALVIIGLLTGGILVGSTLIRAAEVNATIRDFRMLDTAAHTFRLKYRAIPGDARNAVTFLGSTQGVVNGDGNKKIQFSPPAPINEVAEFLRHLSVAGLIPGAYGGSTYVAGLPQTMESASGASFEIAWRTFPYGGQEKHIFYVGTRLDDDPWWDGAFSPEEGLRVDHKIDDGIPSRGIVRAETPGWRPYTDCVTTNPGGGASTGAYVIDNKEKTCIFMIKSSL